MSTGVTGTRLFAKETSRPSSSRAPNSNGTSKSRVIFLTYATHGYPLLLAQHYLEKGHKVALHCVNTDNLIRTRQQLQTYISGKMALIFPGPLNEKCTPTIIENVEKNLGEIDTVFHFASAIRKVSATKKIYEELLYLFDQNVKPFNYIADCLSKRESKNLTKLIAVGPIVDIRVIQDHLIPNIMCFLAHLRMAVDEVAELDDNKLLTRIVDFEEFADHGISFGRSETAIKVIEMLQKIDKSME